GRHPRQVVRFGGIDPRGARCGGLTGGQRISRVLEDVLHAAALDAVGVAPRAVGVDLTSGESVVRGIGVQDDTGRAVLFGHFRLHTAEALPVAGQHDLAPDVHAHFGQPGVVVRQTVVDVHHVCGDVPGWGVG